MKPVTVYVRHADGSEQELDLIGLIRSTVDEHLAGLVAAGDPSQTPADRDLHIRALIRQELAAWGENLVRDYAFDAARPSHESIAVPMQALGRHAVERFGTEPVGGA